MRKPPTKTFLVDYPFKGERYMIHLPADSWMDARERLDSIRNHGMIEGELKGEILVYKQTSWIGEIAANFFCWWENRKGRKV